MRIHSLAFLACGFAAIAQAGCGSGADTPAPEQVGTASADLLSFHGHQAIIPRLPATFAIASTIPVGTGPGAGDTNPYGVAFVPEGFPGWKLHPGDVIVSNFNNATSQGLGTTIVRANPNAAPTVFFQDSGAPGFSTALGVLKRGFVLVGTVPSINTTSPGTCNDLATDVGPGSLLVIDRHGKLVKTLTDDTLLNGPWDLTLDDEGDSARVYVSNVGTGTVTRVDLRLGEDDVWVRRKTQIASGYTFGCAGSAFVAGPTGLAHDQKRDILYVTSTQDNQIFAVPDASDTHSDHGMGTPVIVDTGFLHGPLGLVRADNGDLISAQGDSFFPNPPGSGQSEIVEFSAEGKFVAQFSVEPAVSGSAFGLALVEKGDLFRFAAVDDNLNQLDIWEGK